MANNQIRTPIIPENQIFYKTSNRKVVQWGSTSNLDINYEAIATFSALGFMLDDDTFDKGIKTGRPATEYELDDNNIIVNEKKYWQWQYIPKVITFNEILEEFTALFEKLIKNQIDNKRVLLPISGGLDSRTLFVPLIDRDNLILTSYEFEGGIPESGSGRELAEHYNIPFYTQKISRGYLWNKLDQIAELNNCFTDFIHPRQVAAIHQWEGLSDVILLGHWGDVLFDKQTDSNNISYDAQLIYLKKKILKPGGSELAADLWKTWGIQGSFESYIVERLDKLYGNIDIDHPSARMRAFKSLYWAPRWTSINLSIFNHVGEILLPYYSDEMCKFICTIPEKYLEGRKIQIEYIKQNCPEAAQIPWQQYYPLNLYNYYWFNSPFYYPMRAMRKINRILKRNLFNTPELVTRNWELQFLGEQNFIQMEKNLIERSKFNTLVPQSIIRKYMDKFQINPVKYAHAIAMILTLVVFSDQHYKK